MTNIGGVYINNTVYGDGVQTFEYVEKIKQKQAVNYLVRNVLNCPEWLFKDKIFTKTRRVQKKKSQKNDR
jgi:hypothetical protein